VATSALETALAGCAAPDHSAARALALSAGRGKRKKEMEMTISWAERDLAIGVASANSLEVRIGNRVVLVEKTVYHP
jgi:hypothetical protein